MSLDRSWQDDWAETWLSDPPYLGMLDHWVRRRHVQHHEADERQTLYGSVGPWTVAGLVSDVHRHAMASHWLWATTAICFLQELLFCIDGGGGDISRHLSDDFIDEVKTLRYLRNVVVHPVKMPVKTGENSVDQLCFRMEREPQFWSFAPELLDNWSLFADHRVTRFALRRLNPPDVRTAASSASCPAVNSKTIATPASSVDAAGTLPRPRKVNGPPRSEAPANRDGFCYHQRSVGDRRYQGLVRVCLHFFRVPPDRPATLHNEHSQGCHAPGPRSAPRRSPPCVIASRARILTSHEWSADTEASSKNSSPCSHSWTVRLGLRRSLRR